MAITTYKNLSAGNCFEPPSIGKLTAMIILLSVTYLGAIDTSYHELFKITLSRDFSEIGTSLQSIWNGCGVLSMLVLFVLFLSRGLVSNACAWSFMAVTRQTHPLKSSKKTQKMVSHNILVNNKR